MSYFLLKILLTAIVVVCITEIAKHSTIFAGIFASIPLTSFLAFIWIYWETKNTQKIINLSIDIMLMVIPSFAFFIILPLALKFKVSFALSMIMAIILTAIIYWLYILILNKFGITNLSF